MSTRKSDGFAVRSGQTVLFIGDSITDCGRREAFFPYGEGYVQHIIDLIAAKYPGRRIRFINKAIGGQTTCELRDRWADDVLECRPDWVSLLVGINDCHRMLFHPPEMKVPPEAFSENYLYILSRTREQTRARIVLMDPFYASREADADSHRGTVLRTLPKYIRTVREMARKFNAVHVPLHDIFRRHLRYRLADSLTPDAVHPTKAGHLLIAHEWLDAMGW